MKRLTLIVAALIALSGRVHATEWVCNRGSVGVTKSDLRRVIELGRRVWIADEPLMVIMLPSDSPHTARAMAILGLSPEAARIATQAGLRDRDVRVASSELAALDEIRTRAAAAGYVSVLIDADGEVFTCAL